MEHFLTCKMLDRDLIFKLLQLVAADPMDLRQIIDRLERTILVTILDDPFGHDRPDPPDLDQLLKGRFVDIHRPLGLVLAFIFLTEGCQD